MNREELELMLKKHKRWVNRHGEGVSFRWVDFTGANLRDADLRWGDFDETTLTGANLENASLEGVELRWSNLTGANLNFCENKLGGK